MIYNEKQKIVEEFAESLIDDFGYGSEKDIGFLSDILKQIKRTIIAVRDQEMKKYE